MSDKGFGKLTVQDRKKHLAISSKGGSRKVPKGFAKFSIEKRQLIWEISLNARRQKKQRMAEDKERMGVSKPS